MALHRSASAESVQFVNENESSKGYPVTDQALRKSCDRCYAQKLKCSRSDGSPSRCTRCQKAGLRCFYSTRLARQTQKRTSQADNSTRQQLSRPFRQDPVQSPSLEEQALFDPLSLANFDHDSHALAGSTFYGEMPPEYTWPNEDWTIRLESSTALGVISTEGLCIPEFRTETRIQEPLNTGIDCNRAPEGLRIDRFDGQTEPEHLPGARSQEPLGTGTYNNNEPKLVQVNPPNKHTTPGRLLERTMQNRSDTENGSSRDQKPINLLDELVRLSRRLENFYHQMSGDEPSHNLQSCKMHQLYRYIETDLLRSDWRNP